MFAYSFSPGLSIHVGGVPRDAGGAATPCPPCLAFSGRNIYPQPLRRHTQQGPLWPGVWVQGSVRTDHHCFRGLNPPNGGPYQVLLTIWHLSVFLRPPTLSERSGLLLANNGQNRPRETTIWAVAAKMSAYSLSPGLVHSRGRCTKGYWYWWVCNASLPLSGLFRPKPLPSAPAQAHDNWGLSGLVFGSEAL